MKTYDFIIALSNYDSIKFITEMARGETELDMEGLTQEVDSAAQMILEPSSLSPDRKDDSDDESDISSDTDTME